ncbi:MAG: cell division protein SepF [Promethearchaeota archaeon]
MPRSWKKENNEGFESPMDILGLSPDLLPSFQKFFIKKYNFNSLSQIPEIKSHLRNRKILILDAEDLFGRKDLQIEELKRAIDELKEFLKKSGGSIGRIGDKYLILTPNSQVRISN